MRILTCILLILLPAMVLAGDVQFSLEISATRISTNDYLRVEYLVTNSRKVSRFIPPSFTDFRVVEGPEQTTGFNMENGSIQEYVIFSYLLQPQREGKLAIPAASASVDGKTYRTNAAEVFVSRAVVPGMPEEERMLEELLLRKDESVDGKIQGNIFVRLEVDRKQVFVGEPVVASYKLYTRLRSESRVVKRPSFNGFSVYDMASPENGESTRESYRGRAYNVYLLRKVQLYPLQSGLLELEPAEVENDISFVRGDMRGQDFRSAQILRDLSEGSNNSGAVIRKKIVLQSEPVRVTVQPLPGGDGSIQTVAVGRFSIRSFLDVPEVHRNDVTDLHIQVAGKGNFPMILPPVVEWPGGVDVYEASTAVNYNKFVSPLSGSKLFSIPFSAKKEGSIVIPPVEFRYFDPGKGVYATARTDSLRFEVLPARTGPVVPSGMREEKPVQAWKYILTLLGLVFCFGGIYLLVRRASGPVTADNMDVKPLGEAEAMVPERKDPLEQVRLAYAQGDASTFYRQLSAAINDHLLRRYQVDETGDWEQALAQQGLDAERIRGIRELRDDAGMALYTPLGMEARMAEDLARLERILI